MNDENATLPESPAAQADTGGSPTTPVAAQLEAGFNAALGENSDSGSQPQEPKRKPGQRGPDTKPRKKPGRVSVEKMGDRSAEALFVEPQRVDATPDFEPPKAVVETESLRKGIEAILRGAESIAMFALTKFAKRKLGPNSELAKSYAECGKFPEAMRAEFVQCLVELWQKYFPNVPIGPESRAVVFFLIWIQGIRDGIEGINLAAEKATPAAA